jgi:hypothetical protein
MAHQIVEVADDDVRTDGAWKRDGVSGGAGRLDWSPAGGLFTPNAARTQRDGPDESQ